jgi:hypothetical protein
MTEPNPDDLPIFVQWMDFLAWPFPTTRFFTTSCSLTSKRKRCA